MFNRQTNDKAKPRKKLELQTALRELGTTRCPVCDAKVTVFVTKTNRPFINCSLCSARIFYNGRESIKRLKRRTTLAEGIDL